LSSSASGLVGQWWYGRVLFVVHDCSGSGIIDFGVGAYEICAYCVYTHTHIHDLIVMTDDGGVDDDDDDDDMMN
jgi:hypothetical protein